MSEDVRFTAECNTIMRISLDAQPGFEPGNSAYETDKLTATSPCIMVELEGIEPSFR